MSECSCKMGNGVVLLYAWEWWTGDRLLLLVHMYYLQPMDYATIFLLYLYFSLIVPSCLVLCFHILILCASVKVSYLFLLFYWFKACVAWWCCWFSSRNMGGTTEEEQIHSDIASWPGINMPVKPANSSLKLYGGATFGRLMHDFIV
jgi:hypothetical protein